MLATQPDRPDSPARLKKVTVNLGAPAQQALTEAIRITGRTQTDIINRAIGTYLIVERAMHHGGAVHVRASRDAELERIRPL